MYEDDFLEDQYDSRFEDPSDFDFRDFDDPEEDFDFPPTYTELDFMGQWPDEY